MIMSTAARNAALAAVAALLNGGTIQYQTSSNQEVATCTFGDPAFGDPDAGSITANAIASDTDCVGGTVDHVVLRDAEAAVVATLTVTTWGGGGEVEMGALVVGAHDTLQVTSGVITQPAS